MNKKLLFFTVLAFSALAITSCHSSNNNNKKSSSNPGGDDYRPYEDGDSKNLKGTGTIFLSNLNASSASVYAYQRSLDDDAVVVLLNLSGNAVSFSLGTQPEGTFDDVLDDATGIRFSAGQTLQLPASHPCDTVSWG